MGTPAETQLRSLVTLLDDDDPESVGLVRREILKIGEPILPFLDELRASCAAKVAGEIESLKVELRFRSLQEAFSRLADQPGPDLEEGAFTLCRFAHPMLDPAAYTSWLDKVAANVRASLEPPVDSYAVMQRLNNHLFQELGFQGNEDQYYNLDNSFLNRVIENRRGIPVSLSVLYLLLGRRLELPLYGVGTPGHFLVGFLEPRGTSFYIDPFHRGRLLTAPDVRKMLVRGGYEFRSEYLDRTTPRDILVRMMRNLIAVYHRMGAVERAQMMNTLADILVRKPRA